MHLYFGFYNNLFYLSLTSDSSQVAYNFKVYQHIPRVSYEV
jgi:hypothetical protein